MGSLRAERDAPRQFANGDGFDHFLGNDVDHRHVVRDAVRDDQVLLVRREGAVPDALTNKQIFEDFMRDPINHRDAIGGAEIDGTIRARYVRIVLDGLRPLDPTPLPGRSMTYEEMDASTGS